MEVTTNDLAKYFGVCVLQIHTDDTYTQEVQDVESEVLQEQYGIEN